MLDEKTKVYLQMAGTLAAVNSNIMWDSGQRKEIADEAQRLADAFWKVRDKHPTDGGDAFLNPCALEVLSKLRLKAGDVALTDDQALNLAEKAWSISESFREAYVAKERDQA